MITYLQKYLKHDSLLYSGELEFFPPNGMKNIRDSDGWQSFLGCFAYYHFALAMYDGSHFKGSNINESEQEKLESHVFMSIYGPSPFLIYSITKDRLL